MDLIILQLIMCLLTAPAPPVNSNNCQEGAWVKTIEPYRHRPRSTYLNKDNPISCNGVLHSWKFCCQTGRHRTNTIAVAIWSYQDREPAYIVREGSVFTFQIESDMPNKTMCSNLTTGHVLVSEGDIIGVSFSNHSPLQVISIESNRTSQLLRARNVDEPRDIRESELRVVTNVALQIFPCIYTNSTTDSSSPVTPSPTAPLTSLKVNSTSSYSVLAPPTKLEFMSTNPYTSISYFTAPNNLTELQEPSTNRNSSNSKKTTASTTLLVVVVPVVLVAIGLAIFIITILFLLHFGIRRLCPKSKVTISATNAAFESSYYNLSATRWTGDIQSSQDHEYDLPTFLIAHANPQLSCQNSEIVTVANIAYTQVSAGAKPDVTNSNSSMVYNELYGNFNPDKRRLIQ